jgi:CRP-like cAMP-binding protein
MVRADLSAAHGEDMVDAVRLAAIRSVRPFRLVVDEDLEQLDNEITMSEAVAGSILFEEGDPAGGVSCVIEGTVEILMRRGASVMLGPGAVVGELSLFVPSASRTATARARSAVRLITWSADDLQGRIARHERLATAIVADLAYVLAERLDRRTQDVLSLLGAVGTRLPVSELERVRARILQ